MVWSVGERITITNELHPLKAYSSIVFTEGGIVIICSLLQPENALFGIFNNEDESLIFTNEEQLLNADSPIYVTDEGISMNFKFVHRLNI